MLQALMTGTLFGLLTITAVAQYHWRTHLHGRTVDARTGKPVFCTVELYEMNGQRLALTETNSDGIYALFVPSDRPLELRIAENGYRGKVVALKAIPAGRRETVLDLPLEPF